jgi:hypothetical protein
VERLDELRSELAAQGIVFAIARARLSLNRAFNPSWVARRQPAALEFPRFPTLKAAVHAFERRTAGVEDAQTAKRLSLIGSEADKPV